MRTKYLIIALLVIVLCLVATNAQAEECRKVYKRFGNEYCLVKTRVRGPERGRAFTKGSQISVVRVIKRTPVRKRPVPRSFNSHIRLHRRGVVVNTTLTSRARRRAARAANKRHQEVVNQYPTLKRQ